MRKPCITLWCWAEKQIPTRVPVTLQSSSFRKPVVHIHVCASAQQKCMCGMGRKEEQWGLCGPLSQIWVLLQPSFSKAVMLLWPTAASGTLSASGHSWTRCAAAVSLFSSTSCGSSWTRHMVNDATLTLCCWNFPFMQPSIKPEQAVAGSSQLEQRLNCPSQPAPDEVRSESRTLSSRTGGQRWGEGGQDFKGQKAFHLLNDIKKQFEK